MSMIGVGIHGTGWVSGEHIKSFQKNLQTRVVGLSGRTPESAAKGRSVKVSEIYPDIPHR